MRASVMIYLPAMTLTGEIQKYLTALPDKITVRGVYGEGSSSAGCIYQISNQNCIYMTDEEILDLVHSTVNKIAIAEFNLQQKLWRAEADEIADKVMRAWGILTNAVLLSSTETAEHLVWIKLGVCLGILSFKNNKIIDDLFFVTKPATLLAAAQNELSPAARDKLRAAQVKDRLLSSLI
jgi:protein arginine kinase